MAGYGGDASQAPNVLEGQGYWFKSISDPTGLYLLTEPFGAGEENLESGLGNCQRNGSMVSAFANAYYAETEVPIVGVFAAQGNTAIEWWQPGGAPLNDAINRYMVAKNWLEENGYTVRHDFMVWCQGESDGWKNTSKEQYKASFAEIMDEMKLAGIETCFMVRIGVQKNNLVQFDEIITAQNELCKEREDTVMVCTATAGFVDEGLMSDNVHYNQVGYNKAGNLAGINAAYYVNTGTEPSMYDSRYGDTYDPNTNEYYEVDYLVNTNIGNNGKYNDYGVGRITITDYFACTDIPVVEIDCEEEYVNAVQIMGATAAVSVRVAIRYYDENRTIIGSTSDGNHAYIRIILCVEDQNGNVDPGRNEIESSLTENVADGWIITVNGAKYTLKNK